MPKIVTLKITGLIRTVIHETLASPNIEANETYSLELIPESSWMSLILCYLKSGELLSDEGEAIKIKIKVSKYTQRLGKLYRIGEGYSHAKVLGQDRYCISVAKIHKGACNSHINEKALTCKLLRVGYY